MDFGGLIALSLPDIVEGAIFGLVAILFLIQRKTNVAKWLLVAGSLFGIAAVFLPLGSEYGTYYLDVGRRKAFFVLTVFATGLSEVFFICACQRIISVLSRQRSSAYNDESLGSRTIRKHIFLVPSVLLFIGTMIEISFSARIGNYYSSYSPAATYAVYVVKALAYLLVLSVSVNQQYQTGSKDWPRLFPVHLFLVSQLLSFVTALVREGLENQRHSDFWRSESAWPTLLVFGLASVLMQLVALVWLAVGGRKNWYIQSTLAESRLDDIRDLEALPGATVVPMTATSTATTTTMAEGLPVVTQPEKAQTDGRMIPVQ
ncbi:hypothetical protein HKX48_004063, partial [Thoreauomyces humboldtii]